MPEKLTRSSHFLGATANPHSQDMNRLRKSCLLLLLSLLLAIPGLAQQSFNIQTGLPINFAALILHVNGQPIGVYEFTVSLYPMNTALPWPVGLWLYSYVREDPGGGC
ncbi:MAG: hypothetical protein ABSG11_22070 [Candidatus Korobacteraceae bacterium]|jgi:hypothetical protein